MYYFGSSEEHFEATSHGCSCCNYWFFDGDLRTKSASHAGGADGEPLSAATQAQQSALRGGTEEIDIDAAVPKFKKQGKLHALRSISKLGKITYHALGFSGDNVVKTEVIANYLKAEVEAAKGPSERLHHARRTTSSNIKGTEDWNGRPGICPAAEAARKEGRPFQGRIVAGCRDLHAGPRIGLLS